MMIYTLHSFISSMVQLGIERLVGGGGIAIDALGQRRNTDGVMALTVSRQKS
ncbi:hypothetical protein PY650_21995 [Rhizobium calliandrae]|uniref:Uncharacterized protein n=1 Tax=Rhizobium calliandrae TaxID=1312182 RepID=A0ABT7KI03_9HYPH|nr:hypothetical protein [Rhizobium calliandrae]MDL2408268.1 hypothetical protein [Rhizobium calliandrae]